jgi:hypothetical protein
MSDDNFAIGSGCSGSNDIFATHSSTRACRSYTAQVNAEVACQVTHWRLGQDGRTASKTGFGETSDFKPTMADWLSGLTGWTSHPTLTNGCGVVFLDAVPHEHGRTRWLGFSC